MGTADFSAYGRRGAKVLYRRLTSEQRSEKARAAAKTRWKKTPKVKRVEAARAAIAARWKRHESL